MTIQTVAIFPDEYDRERKFKRQRAHSIQCKASDTERAEPSDCSCKFEMFPEIEWVRVVRDQHFGLEVSTSTRSD